MNRSNNFKRMFWGIVLATGHLLSLHTQDLTAILDTTRFLENPHKGWYHHYYDNGTWGYHGSVEEVQSVPGLDFLYVRMAWSYFEKNEDEYDWSYISDLAATYAPLGYKLVVCFTSLENGTEYGNNDSRYEAGLGETVYYATPSWVRDKGCNGSYQYVYGGYSWQPDWDDPVYLAELEDFYREFYNTFGSEPWLKFMDVGSIGIWGEGHTSFTTDELVPTVAEVKASIDIYNSIFQQNGIQVIIGDDYPSWEKGEAETTELFNYASDRGFGWTDMSVGNGYWQKNYPATCGIHKVEFFADSYLDTPVYMEMGHYHLRTGKFNTWSEPDGSAVYGKAGYGDMTHYEILKCQIETMHTSYASMHGDIHEWLPNNPKTIRTLGNLMGYWYFPTEMTIPEQVTPGTTDTLLVTWKNKGVAPAYNVYSLQVKIEGEDTVFTQEIENSGNMDWMDAGYYEESADSALLTNGSFEDSLTGWSGSNLSTRSWFEVEGSSHLAIEGGSGNIAVQTVTGLEPGRNYRLTGYICNNTAGDEVRLGVRNYGGPEVYESHTGGNTMTRKTIHITMGDTSTSAEIFISDAGGGNWEYADALELVCTDCCSDSTGNSYVGTPETYPIDIPTGLNDGYYKLKFRLYSNSEERLVDIGVKDHYLDEDGFFYYSGFFVGDKGNVPPTAVIHADTVKAIYPVQVTFNASESYDHPDDDSLKYNWYFGDGTTGSGEEITHLYSDSGVYNAKLVVTDGTDADSTFISIHVLYNHTPVAVIAIDSLTAYADESIYFSGESSYDRDNDELEYHWDFGDGTTSTAESLWHKFPETGQYTIVLRVNDGKAKHGTGTDTVTMQIIAKPNAINRAVQKKWAVYPNPARGRIYLQPRRKITGEAVVEVYSTAGQLIHSQVIRNGPENNEPYIIDIDEKYRGLCLVRIAGNERTSSYNVILH